jgi:phenylacetate-coenzyme A ligase PaaK-like adenylate-forming protein
LNNSFVNKLFEQGEGDFNEKALRVFAFQYENNAVYRNFCDALNIQMPSLKAALRLPFLPISFFKSHRVTTTVFEPEVVFESSGTSQTVQSRHLVKELSIYRTSFMNAFERFYGNPEDWCILALLPSYLERTGSSLVLMVKELIEAGNHPQSGFYLQNTNELFQQLQQLEYKHQKTLLLGVTYALLDFADAYSLQCNSTVIMETGGMKGRREELTREEVHEQLKKGFGVKNIHSEYGMTELLSQAYSKGNGIFETPPWMKVLVRDEDDPQHVKEQGRGAINIIDLANVYSCSFIATDDVGEVYDDGSFRILGRMDNSDIRGCSLLAL